MLTGQLRSILASKGNKVVTVAPEASVRDAAGLMRTNGTGAVLVLDGERLVGILTERDLMRRVIAEGREPGTTRVAEVMTREIVVVRPELSVEDAMAVVTEKRCRHLPVFDGQQLVGVVSIGDLTRWAVGDREVQIQQLVNFITGRYPA